MYYVKTCKCAHTYKGRMSRRLKESLDHSEFSELSQFGLKKVHLENGSNNVIIPVI